VAHICLRLANVGLFSLAARICLTLAHAALPLMEAPRFTVVINRLTVDGDLPLTMPLQ
jgi:hypothetical protein